MAIDDYDMVQALFHEPMNMSHIQDDKAPYLVYEARESVALPLDESAYRIVFWKPGWFRLFPDGPNRLRNILWSVFDIFRVFASRRYMVCCVFDGDKLVHRSTVFPKYFAFPFMEKNDVQVGLTWTSPDYRGRQIATLALKQIIAYCGDESHRVWYLVDEENTSSIRVAEKARMFLAGRARKHHRFGIHGVSVYQFHPVK